MNPITKQPKGTAFVEFESASAAEKAAAASANGRYTFRLEVQSPSFEAGLIEY